MVGRCARKKRQQTKRQIKQWNSFNLFYFRATGSFSNGSTDLARKRNRFNQAETKMALKKLNSCQEATTVYYLDETSSS